jgi:hypothetical protein
LAARWNKLANYEKSARAASGNASATEKPSLSTHCVAKGSDMSRRSSVGGSFFDAGEMGEVVNKKGPPGEFGQALKRLAPFLRFYSDPEAHAGNTLQLYMISASRTAVATAANN